MVAKFDVGTDKNEYFLKTRATRPTDRKEPDLADGSWSNFAIRFSPRSTRRRRSRWRAIQCSLSGNHYR